MHAALESRSVKLATLKDYQYRLEQLIAWMRKNHLYPKQIVELDAIVCLFFDHVFHHGQSPEIGNKTFAAV
eukprot:134918-Karenia_brevis.AAC.1